MAAPHQTHLPLLTVPSALFILRTLIAMFLSMAIAFRFDLSSPGSAAVTVALIALPEAGMVLEKSFYRLVGTVMGGSITVVLVGLLSQHNYVFIGAVATWIAVCTAASSYFRAFRAYAWLLCGYTTCLVGFPAYLDAAHAFDIAVDRVTIVSVGILVAGVVNVVLAPTRSAARIEGLLNRVLADLPSLVAAVADEGATSGDSGAVHRRQTKLALDLAELEQTRMSGAFENPEVRLRARHIMLFAEAAMNAFSQLALLHRLTLNARERETTAAPLSELSAALEPICAKSGEAGAIGEALERVRSVEREFDRDDFYKSDAAASLLMRDSVVAIRQVLKEHIQIGAPIANTRQPFPRARIAADGLFAAITGVRAALALLAAMALWVGSRWPDGLLCCVFATVICALLASHPAPRRAVWEMCKGVFLSAPAALFCYLELLPRAQDLPTFMLALTPFLALGAWFMTRPAGALKGTGFLLVFLMSMNLTAVMSFDVANILNTLLASIVGFLIALGAIGIVGPANPQWRGQRLQSALLRSLSIARHGGLVHLRARFEHRVRDFTAQLVSLNGPTGSLEEEQISASVLAVGTAVIRLRNVIDLSAPGHAPYADALDHALAAVTERRWQDLGTALRNLTRARGAWLEAEADSAARIVEIAIAAIAQMNGVCNSRAEGEPLAA